MHLQASAHNNFNPRSPHGERLYAHGKNNVRMVISIHAPRTGSDAVVEVVFHGIF